jgi:hypothetical protein
MYSEFPPEVFLLSGEKFFEVLNWENRRTFAIMRIIKAASSAIYK